MAPDVWDFIHGGSLNERTRAENLRVFERYCLRPSMLVDVSVCDMSRDLLGVHWPLPIGIAPMAFHAMVTPEGELATVRAAARVGAVTVISVMASRSLEEIAATARAPLWLQTYWLPDRAKLLRLVRQAEDLGFRALVLTVDVPRMGRRRRDLRNALAFPAGTGAAARHTGHTGATFDPGATWDDVAWLRANTELPLVLKGVLTAEDALRSIEAGADAIVVSNHGGRQLDGVLPALTALVEVADAVACRTEVLMDGGVRSGTDIMVALALGASAVLVGRPILWGLAASGEAGAADVLSILREELDNAMALAGRPTLADIDMSLISRSPV
jgi:4-hydroxymandelate oxidase